MKKISSIFFLALSFSKIAFSQTFVVTGPLGSEKFGHSVTVLKNGNYVVTDPYHDDGGVTNVGAVYLYNGSTHALISRLTGSSAGDQVGFGGVTALANGHYVVRSPNWKNGMRPINPYFNRFSYFVILFHEK
jgi:hypothetical protein